MSEHVQLLLSIVVPTVDRREHLLRCLASLALQDASPASFEVIVVCDGCRDGTADALAVLHPPWSFRVLVRSERGGLSVARNQGNREARGSWILCLDDDTIADRRLVSEHLAAHRRAGEPVLVQGALAIDPAVARSPFIRDAERGLAEFHRRKSAGDARLTGEEVSGGNISLPKTLLDELGGFNERIRRNTDGELVFRLEQRGIPLVYAPRALATLTHFKALHQSLDAAEGYGRAYVAICRDQPEAIWPLSPRVQDRCSRLRNWTRAILYARSRAHFGLEPLERALAGLIAIAERLRFVPLAPVLYRLAHDHRFWKGVHAESGGRLGDFVPRSVTILCYHQVSDAPVPAFRRYVLPVDRFKRQLRWLSRHGYRVISLDALLEHHETGASLPPRSVALTFDDGYRELGGTAIPELAAAGQPHTHFVNTGWLGKSSGWVEAAPDLPILDADEVRRLIARHGDSVEFQSHGKSHRSLADCPAAIVREEVGDDVTRLERITERPVRYFAYPYGDHDANATDVVRGLGLRAAFTVDQGRAHPGQNRHRLPRVEVFTEDLPFEFGFKVRWGRSPLARVRRFVLRGLRRLVRGRTR